MTFTQRRRPPRTIDFTCDGCSSEFLETEAFTLREAVGELHAAGWVFVQIGDEWSHYCPDCGRDL